MGNYIRIIMITFGGNICLIKKRIMKITYFVQRKLHKNIIIRLHNATKIDNVIEHQGQSNNFESSEFLF